LLSCTPRHAWLSNQSLTISEDHARNSDRCLVVQAGGHVQVQIQRDANAGVAQPLLNHLGVDSCREGQRGRLTMT